LKNLVNFAHRIPNPTITLIMSKIYIEHKVALVAAQFYIKPEISIETAISSIIKNKDANPNVKRKRPKKYLDPLALD